MGNLIIEQLIYRGEKYYYTSPILKKGIQIIEGENGGGKTTFSSLICYGFGMYIKQFDFRESEYHEQIKEDTNNFVILKIKINEVRYELKRYFSEKNSNVIFISGEGINDFYYINRKALTNSTDIIFSDWILDKLGIKVFDIFQGTKQFKIGLTDLFRLIHYDQATSPIKIYKEHRTDNNFVSDSENIRKVIFEILMGYGFAEYYKQIGDYKKIEKEMNVKKSLYENFRQLYFKGEDPDLSLSDIRDTLGSLNNQLEKIELYRDSINKPKANLSEADLFLQEKRRELYRIENKILEIVQCHNKLIDELGKLKKVKEDLVRDVIQIKKIIITNDKLNIFSNNKCPCCLKEITREENQCVCGENLDDEYKKYFYTSDEYMSILKSKKKSIETIDIAIASVELEIEENMEKLKFSKEQKEYVLHDIDHIEKDSIGLVNMSSVTEINDLNNLILDIKKKIQQTEQFELQMHQLEKLEKDYRVVEVRYSKMKSRIIAMEKTLFENINGKLKDFSDIYLELIKSVDDNINKVEIGGDYLPILNNGVYMQASSYVLRRMVYYFTMLYMSIKDEKTNFPKFIIMDTPENLGIDEPKLINCIKLLDNINELSFEKFGELNYQIILTTGIDKYPKEYKSYVVATLLKTDKLLKLVE